MNSLPDSHFLTKHSDFRCFMLVQHLLKFELWAIFIPEAMRVDIYELLKTHGNVTFSYFIDPSGESSLPLPVKSSVFLFTFGKPIKIPF